MPYVPLKFPPGMLLNSTIYSTKARWSLGDRIRWYNNAVRPIGGWVRAEDANGNQIASLVADTSTEIVRNLHLWRSHEGDRLLVTGSNKKLTHVDFSNGDLNDITPIDFPTNISAQENANTGYGGWYYGRSPYGTSRPFNEDDASYFNWMFDTWGDALLAAGNYDGNKLYEWKHEVGGAAQVVANAPTDFDCFAVTEQRTVMMAGSDTEPRLVQWCDTEDNTNWDFSDESNRAGFKNVPGIGDFKAIIKVRDVMLLISETDAHVARYVGAPFVYSFEQVGDDCGVVNEASVLATEEYAIWPGRNSFHVFDGNSVKTLQCEVADHIYASFNEASVGKTVGFVNSKWDEFWWFYDGPGSSNITSLARNTGVTDVIALDASPSNDVDNYVYYNWRLDCWGVGTLNRSAAGGNPALGGPFMVSPDSGYLYSHELDGVIPGENASEVFLLTGPVEMTKGDTTTYIKAIQPDMVSNGKVNFIILGQDRPNSRVSIFGPYTAQYAIDGDIDLKNQPVPARARGHTVRTIIQGLEGTWTLGEMRLDIEGGGQK